MKCEICSAEAKDVVVFHKEHAGQPGYLAFQDEVTFDPTEIAGFVYYCAGKGLHLNTKGVVHLCPMHMFDARSARN